MGHIRVAAPSFREWYLHLSLYISILVGLMLSMKGFLDLIYIRETGNIGISEKKQGQYTFREDRNTHTL